MRVAFSIVAFAHRTPEEAPMRRIPQACKAALLLLLPLLGGCGNKVTAPDSADQQTADDLAIQTAINVTLVGGDLEFAMSSTPLAPQAGARQASPARALWDTTVVANGITYEASRTFYDAAGAPLPDYGPLAVRLRWASRAFGTFVSPRDTASVGHDAVLDVRGIQAGEDTLTFDGTCLDTLQNRFRSLDGSRVRYFYWTSSTTVSAVDRLRTAGPIDGWPLSGTVSYVVSADRLRSNDRVDVEAHVDATVVVTFNGTSQPEIVVNGTYRYRWNMLTGVVTRA
jgi:hypothetical protein